MATVNFRIRSKANKHVSIYVYLSIGRGNVISTTSGFSVHPNDWSLATNRPKQNNAENKRTFNSIKKLENFLYQELNNANQRGSAIDNEWLREKISQCFGRVKKVDSGLLINHIQYIIDNANTRKIKGSSKIGLSKRRVLGYKTFLNIVKEYQQTIRKKIHFWDIDKTFVDKFINWLLVERAYSKNYAGKQIDNLKTVCLDAESLGIDVNPFVKNIESFKESKGERYIVTLSFEELERIKSHELSIPSLINARKWLLIGCEIGQRASDLLKITKNNTRKASRGLYIDIVQQKTNKSVTVGIEDPYLCDLIENHFPYSISTQKLNRHIKTLCKEVGIDEMIEGKKYDKKTKRKIKSLYPKYSLITSHCFRRSFATNYYKKMFTSLLMEITGHSKESIFLEYINKSKDKDMVADQFMEYSKQIRVNREPI